MRLTAEQALQKLATDDEFALWRDVERIHGWVNMLGDADVEAEGTDRMFVYRGGLARVTRTQTGHDRIWRIGTAAALRRLIWNWAAELGREDSEGARDDIGGQLWMTEAALKIAVQDGDWPLFPELQGLRTAQPAEKPGYDWASGWWLAERPAEADDGLAGLAAGLDGRTGSATELAELLGWEGRPAELVMKLSRLGLAGKTGRRTGETFRTEWVIGGSPARATRAGAQVRETPLTPLTPLDQALNSENASEGSG